MFALAVAGVVASAAAPERVLRVCADPNNLPFSNERGEGFENRLAELVARDLGARLEYVWWPQRRGFFRRMIKEGRADLAMGVPVDFGMVLPTRPYYRSTYVFVTRPGGPRIASLDDPRLRQQTIGVQLVGDDFNNTPPAHALTARGMVDNIRGYTVYGDYAQESPPAEVVRAVARGTVDLAVAWGPLAGYYARRQSPALEVTPIEPAQDGPTRPFAFAIAMGVRRGNDDLKRELDAVIVRREQEIREILEAYGVPLLPLPGSGKERHAARH